MYPFVEEYKCNWESLPLELSKQKWFPFFVILALYRNSGLPVADRYITHGREELTITF